MRIKLDLQIEVDEPMATEAIAACYELLRMIADRIENEQGKYPATEWQLISTGAAYQEDYSNGSTSPADISYSFTLADTEIA